MIGTLGAIIMFSSRPYSFLSYLGTVLAALTVPGVFFGGYVTIILTGNPHGGGTGTAILWIATPFNLFFYSALIFGSMKLLRRLPGKSPDL